MPVISPKAWRFKGKRKWRKWRRRNQAAQMRRWRIASKESSIQISWSRNCDAMIN
jgi:hypothetical protein